MDGWLNLAKFLTSSFGLPGSLALAIAGYLVYLLREERAAHMATRDKIDTINEKRIEATAATVKIVSDLQDSLRAITAILGKGK
jgi:hypothetical protein